MPKTLIRKVPPFNRWLLAVVVWWSLTACTGRTTEAAGDGTGSVVLLVIAVVSAMYLQHQAASELRRLHTLLARQNRAAVKAWLMQMAAGTLAIGALVLLAMIMRR